MYAATRCGIRSIGSFKIQESKAKERKSVRLLEKLFIQLTGHMLAKLSVKRIL